jgi:hypothetical protein
LVRTEATLGDNGTTVSQVRAGLALCLHRAALDYT